MVEYRGDVIVKESGVVILKKREKLDEIYALHTILRRIPENLISHEYISNMLSPAEAGFAGEVKTDEFLKELTLSTNYTILQDLIIPKTHSTVQMDTIIITQKFVCILEIKNMTGEFYFDSDHYQFYRIKKDGTKEPQRSPEIQLRRAVGTIKSILKENEIELPVYGIIVFASRSGIVMEKPKHFPAVLLDYLNEYIGRIEKSLELVHPDESTQIADQLLEKHVAPEFDCAFQRYGINKNWVMPGVICPACGSLPMKRLYSKWCCSKCGNNSKDAHLITIQEFRLLFDKNISNRQAGWFLDIPNRDTNRRLLLSAGFLSTGTFRDRKYQISKDLISMEQIQQQDSYKIQKLTPKNLHSYE